MATTTIPATTEMLSLQSRIEQCEAAIETAHTILNRIESVESAPDKSPAASGAMAAIDRCNSQMSDLNSRLSTLADKVGSL